MMLKPLSHFTAILWMKLTYPSNARYAHDVHMERGAPDDAEARSALGGWLGHDFGLGANSARVINELGFLVALTECSELERANSMARRHSAGTSVVSNSTLGELADDSWIVPADKRGCATLTVLPKCMGYPERCLSERAHKTLSLTAILGRAFPGHFEVFHGLTHTYIGGRSAVLLPVAYHDASVSNVTLIDAVAAVDLDAERLIPCADGALAYRVFERLGVSPAGPRTRDHRPCAPPRAPLKQ